MSADASPSDDLLRRASAGDPPALAELLGRYRDRLRQMVRLRLDRRLQGRLDPTEVVQAVATELPRRLPDYLAAPATPFYVWLRMLAGQKLVELQRRHLDTPAAAANQDITLYGGAMPQACSLSLAAQLLGKLTPAAQAAQRAEAQIRVQEALNGLEPTDREILTLRHFEMLSNDETAAALGLSPAAASNGYIRALKQIKGILAGLPGYGSV